MDNNSGNNGYNYGSPGSIIEPGYDPAPGGPLPPQPPAPAPQPQPSEEPEHSPLRAMGIAAVIVVGVIILAVAGYFGYSAYSSGKNDGTLQVRTIAGAQVTAELVGDKAKILGAGSLKTKLTPGQYQVTANTAKAATSSIVTITKQQTATVNLDLQAQVPSQQIVPYTAQDIYATSKSLYYINAPQSTLYTYPLSSSSGRPYLTGRANQLDQTAWVNPTHFFAGSDNTWKYVNGTTSTPVQYKGANPAANSISFNTRGAHAFVTPSQDVILSSSPTAAPQIIGRTSTNKAQTAIAPSGNVLVFGAAAPGSSDSNEPTRLYQTQGQESGFPTSVSGLTSAAWSPDSSKFSYTTNNGIFIYDLATHTVTPVTFGTPSNSAAMFWLNSTTLIYANNGAVWSYQTTGDSHAAVELTSIAGSLSNTDNPFTLAPDGQTLYYSTTPDSKGNGGNIYSIIPAYNSLPTKQQQTLKAAQQAAAAQTSPGYSGDSGLSDYIQPDQLTTVYYDFGRFFTTNHLSVNTVTISNIQQVCHTVQLNDTEKQVCSNIVNFSVSVDGKNPASYNARIDYSGSSTIRMRLYNIQSNKVLYDSGNIDNATS